MIGPFAIDTVLPAFGVIGGEFAVDAAAMEQVSGACLVACQGMSIFHGLLCDAVGRKPVMVAGLTGFAAANVLAAVAPNLGWLLVARLLQGAFAGAATIVSRVVIRDL